MFSFSTDAVDGTLTTGATASCTGKVADGVADSGLPSGFASVLISDACSVLLTVLGSAISCAG
jgi:hypothetical protein